mmetsp:Transcript_2748/g.6731  ORF Transcript_2748/g.6731 Transcript_2748/m.6731 type:complete len:234 (+) Transcript_2748:59-760(+)
MCFCRQLRCWAACRRRTRAASRMACTMLTSTSSAMLPPKLRGHTSRIQATTGVCLCRRLNHRGCMLQRCCITKEGPLSNQPILLPFVLSFIIVGDLFARLAWAASGRRVSAQLRQLQALPVFRPSALPDVHHGFIDKMLQTACDDHMVSLEFPTNDCAPDLVVLFRVHENEGSGRELPMVTRFVQPIATCAQRCAFAQGGDETSRASVQRQQKHILINPQLLPKLNVRVVMPA